MFYMIEFEDEEIRELHIHRLLCNKKYPVVHVRHFFVLLLKFVQEGGIFMHCPVESI